ncbi:ABC transporter ATP-binding protein [Aurantimonas sp. A2-1-M11]|uniref:ABC transporter ATP-binding protein n=1 Tax=Aurantimonas sp. A2-1-M11 TaxID=3113712 RepID=UPI002F95BB66
MATDAICIEGLNAFYGDSHVIHDLSLNVRSGGVLGLLGRNGAGKSTTIGAIIGLVQAQARSLTLFGDSILGLSPERVSRKGVGVVPQGRRIFPSLTVQENLTVAARGPADSGWSGWELKDAYSAFPRLEERQRQFAGSLSGGEQQMLAISRALMTSPRLLLLDEPSEGLAPQIVAEVGRVLKDLSRTGLSIVLVEQNIKLAMEIADDVVILNNGRLAHAGPVESLRADDGLVEQLLGVY